MNLYVRVYPIRNCMLAFDPTYTYTHVHVFINILYNIYVYIQNIFV